MSVSVIVPVFNAERFIRQCLDSIRQQTYGEFEVIVVDDGSTDRSGAICDEYAQEDTRFKVIHQSNGGVSVARQTGIDAAIGDYTIHIDPDDWVDPTMLEELVHKAETERADMVICDYWEEDSLGTHYRGQNPGGNFTAESVTRQILLQQLHGSCWNKLLRRSCYKKRYTDGMDIQFYPDNLNLFEDELFNLRVLLQNIKITYLSKAFYHYRINNPMSLCKSISNQSFQSEVRFIDELRVLLINHPFFHFTENDLYWKKKTVLFDAMRSKRFDEMFSLYPEIHPLIIEEGKHYRWFAPRSSCLSIAMRGYPRLGFLLYKVNISVLKWKQIIHRILVHE